MDYPLVPVNIQFRGEKHRVKVAVNPHFWNPLILGSDWPAFTQLLGILCVDASWWTGLGTGEDVVQAGEAVQDRHRLTQTRTRVELMPPELDAFPLEQLCDEDTYSMTGSAPSIDSYFSLISLSPIPIFLL